jgi:hypothetical protein
VSNLDLWHKGVYPAIAIALTVTAIALTVFIFWSNTDKQRQIDKLQTEMESLKQRQETEERRHQEQVRQAEEQAHKVRVDIYKQVNRFLNISNDPREEKAAPIVRAQFAVLIAGLEMQDENLYGKEQARELWHRARKQAEKEEKQGKIDWFL